MTEEYKFKLEKGLEFQDFAMSLLIKKLGLSISVYGSRKYQMKIGESRQGVEIKFDDKYKVTGNIYIEVAEKSNANNENYVESGINRYDNSWLYVIGNYEKIFIFPVKYLRILSKNRDIFEIKGGTSKGFLLNTLDIDKYCIKEILCNDIENRL